MTPEALAYCEKQTRRIVELEEDLDMLKYFWEDKGDIERYCFYDRVRASGHWPELFKAWDDYKMAERMVDVILKGLSRD